MIGDAPPDTLVSKRRTWGDKKSEFVLEQEHYFREYILILFASPGSGKFTLCTWLRSHRFYCFLLFTLFVHLSPRYI